MPKKQNGERMTRGELDTKLQELKATKEARMSQRALDASARVVTRNTKQAMLPTDDQLATMTEPNKLVRLARARERAEKLRIRALEHVEAAEAIDARIAEIEAP